MLDVLKTSVGSGVSHSFWAWWQLLLLRHLPIPLPLLCYILLWSRGNDCHHLIFLEIIRPPPNKTKKDFYFYLIFLDHCIKSLKRWHDTLVHSVHNAWLLAKNSDCSKALLGRWLVVRSMFSRQLFFVRNRFASKGKWNSEIMMNWDKNAGFGPVL